MEPPELRMPFADLAALERELASNLRLGRAFLQDPTRTDPAQAPAVLSDCVLVLVRPDGQELRLGAHVVMVTGVGPAGLGVGIELRPFGADTVARMEDFASSVGEPDTPGEDAGALQASDDASDEVPEGSTGPWTSDELSALEDDEALARELEGLANEETLEESSGLDPSGSHPHPTSRPPQRSKDVQVETRPAQLRKLSYNDQQKVARTGDLSDRVTVERLYGKSVWRSLLDNPKLTVPEVARIARKGTVPRPLLEIILDNNTWVHATPVRRALMSNPKLTPESILKLLRLTPKHELRLIHKGTAYTPYIREQARKLLG